MSFAINTNTASLQAQEYLRTNSDFQAKTINRVTSGLRIISSGDDAAGLAIANTFRSDQSVLSQGVRNANDGLSQLQIADGGISNISKLLDRARTLATQSSSGAFTGDRSVLSGEFTTVLGEIDRQAQAIGLNQGGAFAKSLGVFIGGGRAQGTQTAITNGSVTVDLSNSTVDSQSLGLKGVQATGAIGAGTSIGTGSTSVQAIVNLAANKAGNVVGGFSDFYFRGTGFSDASRVKVSVNLSTVTDTDTLAAAVNTAITNAGNGTSANATAFRNAGITASVVTDANGSHLAFNSSGTAFQVSAGDLTSNALLGNVTSSSDPTGKSLTNTVTGGSNALASAYGASGAGTITVRVSGGGLASPVDLQYTTIAATTAAQGLAALQTAADSNASLQAAGIKLTTATSGSKLVFTGSHGEALDVSSSGDLNNNLGLGSFKGSTGAGGTFEYSTITGSAGTFLAAANTLEISISGGPTQSITFTPTAATEAATIVGLNNAIAGNALLSAAGFTASDTAGQITLTNNSGSNFRVATVGVANDAGFNAATATGIADVAETYSAVTTKATFDSGGANQTSVLAFSAARLGSDKQTITVTSDDNNGVQQSKVINLQNTGASPNARTLDEAIASINTQLQQSGNATLLKIVAVKEQNAGGTAEGIKFIGVKKFQVSVGQTADDKGIGTGGAQGSLVAADVVGTGSTADISTQDAAQKAVTALSAAVSTLGQAQAVVGRGQNQFGYAINLASSQLTNLAAAESRIRDADLASEAANLTKAQTLLQAGIAALAQANSAPQGVLALLRG